MFRAPPACRRASSSGVHPVTVARVPTAMNTGVSTGPCAVMSVPRRAREPGSPACSRNDPGRGSAGWEGSVGSAIPAADVMPSSTAPAAPRVRLRREGRRGWILGSPLLGPDGARASREDAYPPGAFAVCMCGIMCACEPAHGLSRARAPLAPHPRPRRRLVPRGVSAEVPPDEADLGTDGDGNISEDELDQRAPDHGRGHGAEAPGAHLRRRPRRAHGGAGELPRLRGHPGRVLHQREERPRSPERPRHHHPARARSPTTPRTTRR